MSARFISSWDCQEVQWTTNLHAGVFYGQGLCGDRVSRVSPYGRNFGIARIRSFDNVVNTKPIMDLLGKRNFGEAGVGVCDEGCAVADMTWIAVTLSEAGVGDYWDDVDEYVRNALTEHQVLSRDLVEQILSDAPEHELNPEHEVATDMLDRNMGCFLGTSDPTIACLVRHVLQLELSGGNV